MIENEELTECTVCGYDECQCDWIYDGYHDQQYNDF